MQRAVDLAQSHAIRSLVVSDRDAVQACKKFLDDHRVLVEPACGASLALGYEHWVALQDYQTVLIVVCGGVTATVEQLNQWSRQLA